MQDLQEQWRIEQDTLKAKERAKQQSLRRALDEQLANKLKKQGSSWTAHTAVHELPKGASNTVELRHETFFVHPDVETRVLYRCPVTGKLLPANAF